ncbi:hypothetical protein F4820DRAFT_451932 [Hypoxylon rubiginosum]|uniref:Uncharacterized protein n=1 Tax=Hypoxylon rubiginosum TaxID=110542 RepID=A0ACB9YPW8_9PEZI|nr:hypothetical protein F4820DRAFT_451932 [Hypoxylon rubiginosum]
MADEPSSSIPLFLSPTQTTDSTLFTRKRKKELGGTDHGPRYLERQPGFHWRRDPGAAELLLLAHVYHSLVHGCDQCGTCKKVTGGTHSNMLLIQENTLTINDESALRIAQQDPAFLEVFVGCLRDMDYLDYKQPQIEMNTHEKLAWLPSLGGAFANRIAPAASPAQGSDL